MAGWLESGGQGGLAQGAERPQQGLPGPPTGSPDNSGPFLPACFCSCASVGFELVATLGDWFCKDLLASWRGVRRRSWPGPAAGGGSDRFLTWVPGTVLELDRPPQPFLRDLNGRSGLRPASKR